MPYSEVEYAPSYWGKLYMKYVILAFEYICQESLLNAYLHNIGTAIFFFSKSLWHYPRWAEIASPVLLSASWMSDEHKTHNTNIAWFMCSLNKFSTYEKKKYQRTLNCFYIKHSDLDLKKGLAFNAVYKQLRLLEFFNGVLEVDRNFSPKRTS